MTTNLLDDSRPYVLSTRIHTTPPPGREGDCNGLIAENGGRDRHWVPHFFRTEQRHRRVPRRRDGFRSRGRGWGEDDYPEYGVIKRSARKSAALDTLTVPVSKSANDVAKRIADQSPRDGQVHVMPVQGNIYMLVADGTNITASVGRDGIAIVNTGSAPMTDKVLAALTELARTAVSAPATNTCVGANCPGMPSWSSPYFNTVVGSPRPARPMRYVINTSALRIMLREPRSSPPPGRVRRGVSAVWRRGGASSARRQRSSPRGLLTAMTTPSGNATVGSGGALLRTHSSTSSTSCRYTSTASRDPLSRQGCQHRWRQLRVLRHSEVIAAGNSVSRSAIRLIDTPGRQHPGGSTA